MKKFISTIFLTTLFIISTGLVTQTYAQMGKEDIRQMLDERNEEIKALLGPNGTDYTEEKRQELKDIINEVIDYGAMAKFALQETWESLSGDQQQNFVKIFSQIVRDHSLTNLDIYRAEVTYEGIDVNGGNAEVVTLATLGRVRTPVTYELAYRDNSQKWVVVDLIVDGVSTAKSYRRQFQDIIRDKGYDYLYTTLKDRAEG